MTMMKMSVTQTPFEELQGQEVVQIGGVPEVAIVPAATEGELPSVMLRFPAEEHGGLQADMVVEVPWIVPMAIEELLVKAFPNLEQYKGQLVNIEGTDDGEEPGQDG